MKGCPPAGCYDPVGNEQGDSHGNDVQGSAIGSGQPQKLQPDFGPRRGGSGRLAATPGARGSGGGAPANEGVAAGNPGGARRDFRVGMVVGGDRAGGPGAAAGFEHEGGSLAHGARDRQDQSDRRGPAQRVAAAGSLVGSVAGA